MTTEQVNVKKLAELNKKLGEWAFPAALEVEIVSDGIWVITDEGSQKIDLLTHSTDACFEWLVPPLVMEWWFPSISLDYPRGGYEGETNGEQWFVDLNYNGYDRENRLEKYGQYVWFGYADKNPALALCKAIEQLIDAEVKEEVKDGSN